MSSNFKKAINKSYQKWRSKGFKYANAFKPQTTQLYKQPGLSFIRRTFTQIYPLGYPQTASITVHQPFVNFIDIQHTLGVMNEYSSLASAYKFIKINNLKIIVHSFLAQVSTECSFPIAIGYDGACTSGSTPGVNVQNVAINDGPFVNASTSSGTISNNSFHGYNQIMSIAKSKLISTTPDYFTCEVNNSANRLREPVTAVAKGSGNYGFGIVYGIQPVTQQAGEQFCTIQIILDVLLFEQ